MGIPTPEQRRESQRRAQARRELIDGRWIATERPPEDHGIPWIATYFACECVPCRACLVNNNPDRRAALRRGHLARRELIDGRWIATHLPERQHGTPSASDYYGCQCDTCVEAARQRRARRPRRPRRKRQRRYSDKAQHSAK